MSGAPSAAPAGSPRPQLHKLDTILAAANDRRRIGGPDVLPRGFGAASGQRSGSRVWLNARR